MVMERILYHVYHIGKWLVPFALVGGALWIVYAA
jgi:hypothetical protein